MSLTCMEHTHFVMNRWHDKEKKKKKLNLFKGFETGFFPQVSDVVQYKLLDFGHVAKN